MSYDVGQAVRYMGKQWHIFAIDQRKQTVELCDCIVGHADSTMPRCLHAEVTYETLAHAKAAQGRTHADYVKEMLDKLEREGVVADEPIRTMVEQVAKEAAEIGRRYSFDASRIQYQAAQSFAERNFADRSPLNPQELIDERYGQNKCYGFSVLYCKPTLEDDALIQYGSDYAAELCGSLAACWDMVDYLVDAEEGQPVAIRHDLKVVYYQKQSRWLRNYDEYDEVPAAYASKSVAEQVADIDRTIMQSFADFIHKYGYGHGGWNYDDL